MTSEALREEQGRDHEDHQYGGDGQAGGVDGAHRRSTALTTSPKIAKIATVRATKMTSAILRLLGFDFGMRAAAPDGRPHN
ncbi:hypothetical protein Sme01_69860 [Sphaerisporangium melleum]|uniref:Uncharacterized protein n=1 Tax=Sphaerisporangium melleum TaxID=321316 RepID=A0A917VS86_9ACTN|nr:hypothetical protein GCM10007964_64520 [Sphaerisporangium melleum]GII74510.1 hypothetical protein Sme01_69860 [Sphaerisporangium melleum]